MDNFSSENKAKFKLKFHLHVLCYTRAFRELISYSIQLDWFENVNVHFKLCLECSLLNVDNGTANSIPCSMNKIIDTIVSLMNRDHTIHTDPPTI